MNQTILNQVFWDNRILDYFIAGVVLLFSLTVVKVVISAFVKRFKKFAEKTTTTLDDLFVTVLVWCVLNKFTYSFT
ncbi:hypothetical protein OMAG_002343 [Candidatus Omnitrophus magneticus]|uniref:Mechanosensitive ion channel protein MscS n=1 Tax=Candidatus Omnitrophus magneticus TaxID=1609969 RepID=A0A0F0CKN7_9BACT|nr:hypothetical protein OMAG_002343 [Candidatus Omnitrophus magneticus]